LDLFIADLEVMLFEYAMKPLPLLQEKKKEGEVSFFLLPAII